MLPPARWSWDSERLFNQCLGFLWGQGHISAYFFNINVYQLWTDLDGLLAFCLRDKIPDMYSLKEKRCILTQAIGGFSQWLACLVERDGGAIHFMATKKQRMWEEPRGERSLGTLCVLQRHALSDLLSLSRPHLLKACWLDWLAPSWSSRFSRSHPEHYCIGDQVLDTWVFGGKLRI